MVTSILRVFLLFAFADFHVSCLASTRLDFHLVATVYRERQTFENSNASFVRDQFVDIKSSADGGALFFSSEVNHTLLLQTTTFMNTSATAYGGAVFASERTICQIKACNFFTCASSISGGGIHLRGQIYSSECRFRNCSSQFGGAANLLSHSNTGVMGTNEFESGRASTSAGGVYLPNPAKGFNFTNCSFIANAGVYLGGLYFSTFDIHSTPSWILYCRFVDNTYTHHDNRASDVYFHDYAPSVINHTCFIGCVSSSTSPLVWIFEKGDASPWMYGRPISSFEADETDQTVDQSPAATMPPPAVPVGVVVGATVGVVVVAAVALAAFLWVFRSHAHKGTGYTPL